MVFEHIWRDPDFNINNGKQWNPFADNITAQDMNYIVSNLNYVADNIGAFTENAEEAVRIASDASNLSIQASEKVNIAVNASNEALQKANTADINSAEAVAKVSEVLEEIKSIPELNVDEKIAVVEEKIPKEYVKDATVSDDTLTITKKDGSTVEFQGGGSNSYTKEEIDLKLQELYNSLKPQDIFNGGVVAIDAEEFSTDSSTWNGESCRRAYQYARFNKTFLPSDMMEKIKNMPSGEYDCVLSVTTTNRSYAPSVSTVIAKASWMKNSNAITITANKTLKLVASSSSSNYTMSGCSAVLNVYVNGTTANNITMYYPTTSSSVPPSGSGSTGGVLNYSVTAVISELYV